MTIRIPKSHLEALWQHGEDTYPEECCGVLIAEPSCKNKIKETRKMHNTNSGSKSTRYNIDPLDLLKLEDELDEKGLIMVGIYHSHPDHPPKPSSYDLNHAWPNLTYLVLSVNQGQTGEITAWKLSTGREEFIQEDLVPC